MSREQFEQLVTVPEWAAFDPVHGYSNPEWQDLDPATNFVRLDELSRINAAWCAYQFRQPEIDALHARIAELEADLSRAYDAFGIGEEARQPVVLMTNIENARRRSNCLSRIESILSAEEVCEDGDIDSVSLLRWGDEPDVYEARFRKVLDAQVRTAGADALEKMAERFRDWWHCFRRAAEECEEEARRLRGEGE